MLGDVHGGAAELVLDVVPELVGHDHADPHVTEANGVVGVDDAVAHDELVRERRDEGVAKPLHVA